MRELAPFVVLLCACGAAVREPPSPTAAMPASPAPAVEPEAPDTLTTFDAMAARDAALVPGMREASRKESAAGPVDLVKADARDTCVRVAFAATAPITAKLVDHAGNVLASTDAPATDGVLGAHGPVCIRKGDILRGVADTPGPHVRWLAWEAP